MFINSELFSVLACNVHRVVNGKNSMLHLFHLALRIYKFPSSIIQFIIQSVPPPPRAML